MRRKKQEPVKTCLKGHPLTQKNMTKSGRCLTCRHEREGFKGNVANKDKTHCPAGHPYSGDNVARYDTGKRKLRVCRRCRAEKARQYYQEKVKPLRPVKKPRKRLVDPIRHPHKTGRPRIFD